MSTKARYTKYYKWHFETNSRNLLTLTLFDFASKSLTPFRNLKDFPYLAHLKRDFLFLTNSLNFNTRFEWESCHQITCRHDIIMLFAVILDFSTCWYQCFGMRISLLKSLFQSSWAVYRKLRQPFWKWVSAEI